jgi:sugar phosphate isomerase/epimerase
MKLAFSTLGCPNWELDQIAATARRLGYDGVELRAVGGSLDLLDRPEFRPGKLKATRELFAASNLEICCVDTSGTVHSPRRTERRAQIELALKHAELAVELGAPSIRVFPDRIQAGASRNETRDYISESLSEIAERLPQKVCVALETHGDFARSEATVEIVNLVNHPPWKVLCEVAN